MNAYLDFHFGQSVVQACAATGRGPAIEGFARYENAPVDALAFPARCARYAAFGSSMREDGIPRDWEELAPKRRVLDVGCACGGAAFEFASLGCGEVVGFDFSKALIDAAKEIRDKGEIVAKVKMEGDAEVDKTLVRPCDDAVFWRVKFHVGDACEMVRDAQTLGKFDVVLVANLLCRVPRPRRVLDGLEAVVKINGIVALVTPWSWLDEYTPDVNERLEKCGITLKEEMEKRGFERIGAPDEMPCFIREHYRKAQYIVSEATRWRKVR